MGAEGSRARRPQGARADLQQRTQNMHALIAGLELFSGGSDRVNADQLSGIDEVRRAELLRRQSPETRPASGSCPQARSSNATACEGSNPDRIARPGKAHLPGSKGWLLGLVLSSSRRPLAVFSPALREGTKGPGLERRIEAGERNFASSRVAWSGVSRALVDQRVTPSFGVGDRTGPRRASSHPLCAQSWRTAPWRNGIRRRLKISRQQWHPGSNPEGGLPKPSNFSPPSQRSRCPYRRKGASSGPSGDGARITRGGAPHAGHSAGRRRRAARSSNT